MPRLSRCVGVGMNKKIYPLVIFVMDGNRQPGGPPLWNGWCDTRGGLTGRERRSREAECGDELEHSAGPIIEVRGELLGAKLSPGWRGVPAVGGPANELACGPRAQLGNLADSQDDDDGEQGLTCANEVRGS